MDETLFYVFGIALVLSALALAALGLRNESFPPNRIVLAGVIAYFVAMVGATTTFAFLNARDEQRKRNAEEAATTQPAPSRRRRGQFPLRPCTRWPMRGTRSRSHSGTRASRRGEYLRSTGNRRR